jgi:hypothetical protein
MRRAVQWNRAPQPIPASMLAQRRAGRRASCAVCADTNDLSGSLGSEAKKLTHT